MADHWTSHGFVDSLLNLRWAWTEQKPFRRIERLHTNSAYQMALAQTPAIL